jgi:hypothetical protein
MKIPEMGAHDGYFGRLGGQRWRCTRLFQLAKDLPVMDVPLDHLNLYYTYEKLSLRRFVMHMRAVQDANLDYPIILDEDGEVMDGRHRIMKAMLTGAKTIKAVRFDENPTPDEVEKE